MRSFFKKLTRTHVLTLVFIEIIAGIAASVASFAVLIKLRTEVFAQELSLFDHAILQYFSTLRSPLTTQIMKIFSFLGYELLVLAGILLVVLFLLEKHKREAALFSLIVGMSPVITIILKNLNQRPRPTLDPLIYLFDYSFPSGHAMTSFVFYASLAYFVYHFTKNKSRAIFTGIFSAFMITMIGTSRIYLGVHYPTDVIAGYLGGICWFSCIMFIDKTLDFFELFRETKLPQ